MIYHIDDEDTPYLVKLPVGPDKVTLGDFKNVLNRPNYKFFFKSMDDDFGVVKEEIIEDECPLPCFNGRVVSWLVLADGSVLSDSGSQCGTESIPPGAERGPGVGETRPPSFHGGPPDASWGSSVTGGEGDWPAGGAGGEATCSETDSQVGARRQGGGGEVFDDTESSITSVSQIGRRRHQDNRQGGRMPLHGGRTAQLRNQPGGGGRAFCNETSSVLSSEIDNTSFFETDDNESMASSRFTTSTEHTSVSQQHANRIRKQKRLRHRKPTHMSRASSISSVTDSTLSLNIITVTLNMDTVNFLGISIVGQSNQGGDGGIYVGSIMKGGAVALDGRIEPGDMILQVNDINFENMSNDDAVRVLRDVVQKPGPIKLVVAKCWDPNPKDYFSVPRTEPVRPIDPGAWVAHTAAVRGLEVPHQPPSIAGFTREMQFAGRAPSVTTLTSSSPSLASTIQEKLPDDPLTKQSGMKAVCASMQKSDSGLEVRDRMWLKITIPSAFIGSDVVNWLFAHVQGFQDRREARKYASQMLKAGFIKHTVNKANFSEQCYYIFGDITSNMAVCSLKQDSDGTNSETDRDTLAPLPQPAWSPNPPYPVNPAQFPPAPPGPIYNPAPPPSATYMSFNYDSPPSAPPPAVNYGFHATPGGVPSDHPRSSGSTGSGGSVRVQLAASGSGSESEVGPPPPAWTDPPMDPPPLPPGGPHQGMFMVPPQTGV